jgi:hypothetical protein
MRLVKFPSVAVAIIAGVEISFMALTLAGELEKREDFLLRIDNLLPCPRRAQPQS